MTGSEVPRSGRRWGRATAKVLAATPLVLLGLGVVAFLGSGIGDVSYTLAVRNDTGSEIRLECALAQATVQPCGSLGPGEDTTLERIGGPAGRATILVKAYDPGGMLVYCRELEFTEWKDHSRASPLPIRTGELGCR